MHNEYFYHNEPHNDAPSVSVRASGEASATADCSADDPRPCGRRLRRLQGRRAEARRAVQGRGRIYRHVRVGRGAAAFMVIFHSVKGTKESFFNEQLEVAELKSQVPARAQAAQAGLPGGLLWLGAEIYRVHGGLGGGTGG